MTYFSKFPLTTYELNDESTAIVDILRRVKFISEYKPYSDLFTSYTILDGDTPQSLALEYYDSVFYHWVILLFNEIHDLYNEWPLEQLNLTKKCQEMYGPSVMYMTRHYERNGNVVGHVKDFTQYNVWTVPVNPGPSDPSVYPVSFLDYETKLNDDKRKISIMRPELLKEFVDQFESAVNE